MHAHCCHQQSALKRPWQLRGGLLTGATPGRCRRAAGQSADMEITTNSCLLNAFSRSYFQNSCLPQCLQPLISPQTAAYRNAFSRSYHQNSCLPQPAAFHNALNRSYHPVSSHNPGVDWRGV
jgi:hypothetical protein